MLSLHLTKSRRAEDYGDLAATGRFFRKRETGRLDARVGYLKMAGPAGAPAGLPWGRRTS